jgi:hypothetical protein
MLIHFFISVIIAEFNSKIGYSPLIYKSLYFQNGLFYNLTNRQKAFYLMPDKV